MFKGGTLPLNMYRQDEPKAAEDQIVFEVVENDENEIEEGDDEKQNGQEIDDDDDEVELKYDSDSDGSDAENADAEDDGICLKISTS